MAIEVTRAYSFTGFHGTDLQRENVVVGRIAAATHSPVAFSGVRYIRVGTATKALASSPTIERELWRVLERVDFESNSAIIRLNDKEILDLIDYGSYFGLLNTPLPDTRAGIIEHLLADKLLSHEDGIWSVTNLGAVAFGRGLSAFDSVSRKALRVIHYRGNSRVETIHEREFDRGYANGFESVIEYITGRFPQREEIGAAFRTNESAYPPIAIRELVANALVHQDFSISGTGPMVEIFSNRVEIINPGTPILPTERFVDMLPQSRNEKLASLLRRAFIVEERGTGWDKVAYQVELFRLPAPRVEVSENHTRAVLLGPQQLTKLATEDRIRAVYLHAALRQVTGEFTSNQSVRDRFMIATGNSAQASRILKEATDAGVIVVRDPEAGSKARQYVPFWAATTR